MTRFPQLLDFASPTPGRSFLPALDADAIAEWGMQNYGRDKWLNRNVGLFQNPFKGHSLGEPRTLFGSGPAMTGVRPPEVS